MIEEIIIKTDSRKSRIEVLENIHKQLVGNQDYIDCNIILNDDNTSFDGTGHEVHVYMYGDIKNRPDIIL